LEQLDRITQPHIGTALRMLNSNSGAQPEPQGPFMSATAPSPGDPPLAQRHRPRMTSWILGTFVP